MPHWKNTRSLLLVCLIWCSAQPSMATHIVGGEMTYTCLGDNNYDISLTIFRDCFYGNPAAWFDNPASIGIFDENNVLLQQLLLPLMNNDTLQPVLNGECLVIPPDVCVHTTTYRTIVNLPPRAGGYQLAYQRCCRNQTIVNIVNPLATGATYGVVITEAALLGCNSSPTFNAWPPLYICVNQPIVFDQSAFDSDGDSIVYRLCAPLQGATPSSPQPQPPNAPPYDIVNWISPTYSVENMLNGIPGGAALTINPQTGLLTGLPNTIGQFVVGICAEEYRDGVLISTTRRDFQYNVGICGETAAAFFAPAIQCGNLTVAFDNESEGTSQFLWLFGDPANPDASSTAVNPVYAYPDTGRYTVTLIAAPNSFCADTLQQEIYLQPASLVPGFSFEFTSCSDTVTIQVTNTSVDTLFDIVGYEWRMLPENQTATVQNPTFLATELGPHQIRLTVRSSNGCEESLVQDFPVELIVESLNADTLRICPGESVALNTAFNPSYSYQWSPAASLNNASIGNPIATPETSTTYRVTITNTVGGCEAERQTTVLVSPEIVLQTTPDTTFCSPDFLLSASSPTVVAYTWAADPGFAQVIANTATVTVTPFGQQAYYLRAVDANGCTRLDTVLLNGQGVNSSMSAPAVLCPGEQTFIAVFNLDAADVLSYQWSPAGLIFSPTDASSVLVRPDQPGPTTFYVAMANQFGCTRLDSLVVTVIDTSAQQGTFAQQQCAGYRVQFSTSSLNGPLYRWDFGDAAQPGAGATGAEVSHAYSAPGLYTVTVILDAALNCPDTLLIAVSVADPQIFPAFDWVLESCEEVAVVNFQDLSTNSQSDIIAWHWDFGNGSTATVQNPQVTFTESLTGVVQLVISSSDGCRDTLQQPFAIDLIELDLPDAISICPGESAALHPGADPSYSYQWSPATGLSDATAPNPIAAPLSSTVYQVTVTDAAGVCTKTGSVSVSVSPPLLYTGPPDTTACGGSVTLAISAAQPLTYAWRNPAGAVIGQSASVVVPVSAGAQPYTVTLRDASGCTLTDTVVVTGAGIQASLPTASGVCIGDTVQLGVILLSGAPVSYAWSPAAGIVSGGDSATPTISPAASGTYSVLLQNAAGCALSLSTQVNVVNIVPPLSASANPVRIAVGESSQLQATAAAGYTYQWSPAATLNNPGVANPVASPAATTTYTVTVRDANGCRNQALVTVTVFMPECAEPYIFLPTAFTPNGDNLNDQLFLLGRDITELRLIIYNRWGEEVFSTTDQAQGWDGTYRGQALPPDVYGYYYEVRCGNGEVFSKKGNVSLLR